VRELQRLLLLFALFVRLRARRTVTNVQPPGLVIRAV
jgi:hypothetical protein